MQNSSKSQSPSPSTARTADASSAKVIRPLLAIRAHCLGDCRSGSTKDVRECGFTMCPLHEYRLGRRPPKGTAKRTPIQALRAYCLWCCVNQRAVVRLCPAEACPCWLFRLGKRPMLPQLLPDEIAPESGSYGGSFPDQGPVWGAFS